MAETTAIGWTDSTFNPWIGCQKVGPGCDHCYAEADFDQRKHRAKWGAGEPRSRTSAANWKNPLRWEREHAEFFAEHGRRRRVFCASLGDVFDNAVPMEWRQDLFELIEKTPHLDWLLLTKRVGNVQPLIREVRPADWLAECRNVWLGVTICNQQEADRDIPKLVALPANVRFLSIEPLLGAVDLARWLDDGGNGMALAGTVDWVIIGGESGPCARPMDGAWVQRIRQQCASSGVPVFFKQWGGRDARKGGCLLAGAEHKAWPVMV
ncbi:MAG: phage Gp37/Gp68 family protein [Burkholderiales bacterium]|nr:MAG: phage Gp37/Gp68 family protein [Burkholderiales bacterium]